MVAQTQSFARERCNFWMHCTRIAILTEHTEDLSRICHAFHSAPHTPTPTPRGDKPIYTSFYNFDIFAKSSKAFTRICHGLLKYMYLRSPCIGLQKSLFNHTGNRERATTGRYPLNHKIITISQLKLKQNSILPSLSYTSKYVRRRLFKEMRYLIRRAIFIPI